MNASHTQNLEEAANVATEFLYSLDNLPAEVRYLLEELKQKDTRAQELQQQVESDSARFIRHSLRASSSSATIPPSPSPSPTKNTAHLPAKIASCYAEIQQLSVEKCALSERIIELVRRTRARLDMDLVRVRVLQGDIVEPAKHIPSTPSLYSANLGTNPALQISESLRNALGSGAASGASTPTGSVSAAPPQKRRRIAATASAPSIKLPAGSRSISPAAAPPPKPAQAQTHLRSRLSRQVHPSPEQDEEDAEGEEDVEGEEDGEEEEEDTTLYCFCRKRSYGDMIACDNEGNCTFEWFHMSCVGLKPPAPAVWYCSTCASKGAGRKLKKKS